MRPALVTGGLKHLQLQRAVQHTKEWQERGHKLQPSADGGWLAHGWPLAGSKGHSNLVSLGSQGSLWLLVMSPAAERAES